MPRTPPRPVCYNTLMKLLNGKEIAEFIQERQSRQVRALQQAWGIQPKLAIIVTIDHPVINIYMKKKKEYGAEIEVDVEIHKVKQVEVPALLKQLNADSSVHGIIIQLPLEDPDQTDKLTNMVAPQKDVDGLGKNAILDPATPMAILWLLAGYNVSLDNKRILLVGRGKLVGAPLEKMLQASGKEVFVADRNTEDLKAEVEHADIVITATGSPAIIFPEMIKRGAVLVDAGVASESGKAVGDLAPEVYNRDDITVTPLRGGVGPLTVCALFENVIRAASNAKEQQAS